MQSIGTGEPSQQVSRGIAEPDLPSAVAAVTAAAQRCAAGSGDPRPQDLLTALRLLRWAQEELAGIEPVLITAVRAAGVSWQELAPALGVASRQAAERRYLRLAPVADEPSNRTRDGRVQAERDRRAGHRAVLRWAKDNTADLRRLAGQITALTDLDDGSAAAVGKLHEALAAPDSAALPELLARVHRHLDNHPALADQVEAVTATTERVRQRTQRNRENGPA